MDTFSKLSEYLSGKNDSDLLMWAAVLPILVVAIFVVRLAIRGMVNRKVHAVSAQGIAFLSLTEMRKRGLVSEREFKAMRQRMARRQMEEMKQAEASRAETSRVAAAVALHADAARSLIKPETNPMAQAALSGLGRPHHDGEDEWAPVREVAQAEAALALGARSPEELEELRREEADRVAAQLAEQLLGKGAGASEAAVGGAGGKSPKPIARPDRADRGTSAEPLEMIPGADDFDALKLELDYGLADPLAATPPAANPVARPVAKPAVAPPTPAASMRKPVAPASDFDPMSDPAWAKMMRGGAGPSAADKAKTKEIDALLAKGLISQEEYDKIAERLRQKGAR